MTRFFVCFMMLAVASVYAATTLVLTDAQRQRFVDAHNQARDNVPTDFPDQAPATCLPHVIWDTYLEEMAQAYADGCPTGHSSQDYRKYSDGSYVGENLAWSCRSDAIETANKGWYEEYKDYHYEKVGDEQAMVGHYTQMVWNRTIHIGCGWKKNCPADSILGCVHDSISCNYWPGGNYIGQYPWTQRTSGPAATCPAPTSSSAATSSAAPSSAATSSSAATEDCTSGACCDTKTHKFRPNTYVCRGKNGTCDVEENCTGRSASCPDDKYAPNTTLCATHSGVCEEDAYCTGKSKTCPDKKMKGNTTICRDKNGACDVAEYCNGKNVSCPTNKYAPNTTKCYNSTGPCEEDTYCSGKSRSCPKKTYKPDTFECAPGIFCTGKSAACSAIPTSSWRLSEDTNSSMNLDSSSFVKPLTGVIALLCFIALF